MGEEVTIRPIHDLRPGQHVILDQGVEVEGIIGAIEYDIPTGEPTMVFFEEVFTLLDNGLLAWIKGFGYFVNSIATYKLVRKDEDEESLADLLMVEYVMDEAKKAEVAIGVKQAKFFVKILKEVVDGGKNSRGGSES